MQTDMDRAARMAARCLLRLNSSDLPIRPLEILRRCPNVRVVALADAEEMTGIPSAELERIFAGVDALTYRFAAPDGTIRYVVCYRADGNRARMNFTLAHELGHIVLQHRSSEPWEEREADAFASHLLCPDAVWRRLPRPLYAEHLAKLFYVSVAAAQRLGDRKPPRLPADMAKELEMLFASAVERYEQVEAAKPFWHLLKT